MNIEYSILAETTLQKTIYSKVTEIGIPVYFSQPEITAKFPVIVMQPPISKPQHRGAAWSITVTLEVWGNKHFDPLEKTKETADYFTELKLKMLELNFMCVNQLATFKDLSTGKIRYGGYFEARWNATTNSFERSK